MNNTTGSRSPSSLHYGWIILGTGVGVMFACLGLGRFALGMLLPAMGDGLGLNYSQMGLISTANFIGYMVSVIFVGRVANRFGPRLTISAGLMIIGISMALIWGANRLAAILVFYFLTGIGSGLANIPMMALVAGWFVKHWRGRAAGFMLVGNGLGIIFSGFIVPLLIAEMAGMGWRFGWLILGGVVLSMAALAAIALRNSPAQVNQRPMGADRPKDGGPDPVEEQPMSSKLSKTEVGKLVQLGLVYSLFGATYAVYATFIVTSLVNERGFDTQAAGLFWSIVGVISLFSGPYAGYIADRFGRFTALTIIFVQFSIAHLLALQGLPTFFLYLSIFAFGLSLWGIPSVMAATVGDLVGPARTSSAFGFVTIFFGIGQVAGPALAGFLAEFTGLFDAAFLICAVLTAIAAAACARLSKKGDRGQQ
ncbi:MAG: MFS transporter [Desulfofustis sp.]|nr:MFS transporter [Desulfofustis sp.]NNK13451.1 MFS transporter [Desulfofustis sp.]